MSSSRLAILLKDLSFSYVDDAPVLQGLGLEIQEGELFCLLGPNGAGKTTLIRLILGQLQPTSGCVELAPAEGGTAPRFGSIPQSAGMFDSLGVGRHLEHFARIKGLSKREVVSEVARVVEACELEELLPRRVGHLSGGQRRKVLLALALLGDPRNLVLDEPTVGLDPEARRVVWDTIEAQKRAGKTVVLTTHYLDEAEKLADRVGFLDEGRVSHAGTLPELYASVGKSFRVVRLDPDTQAECEHFYADSAEDARRIIEKHGLDSYSVGRVKLEDIYLRLVGRSAESLESE